MQVSPMSSDLMHLPPEIILHILSYLDFPETDVLSSLSAYLRRLVADPALNRIRILVITPARVDHLLGPIHRPAFDQLVQRGVVRGLNLARRWRQGAYLYSKQSVQQYELYTHHRLLLVRRNLSAYLSHRLSYVPHHPAPHASPPVQNAPLKTIISNPLRALYALRIIPDVESSSLHISRALLPTLLALKKAKRRDEMKRVMSSTITCSSPDSSTYGSHAAWFVDGGRGTGKWREDERIRLAICPGVKRVVSYWEGVCAANAPLSKA